MLDKPTPIYVYKPSQDHQSNQAKPNMTTDTEISPAKSAKSSAEHLNPTNPIS